MDQDEDVDDLLEKVFKRGESDKNGHKKESSKVSSRSKSEKSRRSSSRGRRSKRSRSRSQSQERKRRSSRDRHRSRSRSHDRHKRSRSPSRDRWSRRDASPARRLPGPERRDVLDQLSMPFAPRRSPPRTAKLDLTPEERDERTIFILQLARQTRPRDLEEFFSSVGHVRDVRVITDTKTRRSKGIAYVEFWEREAVPLAMGLNGQKIHGAPLVIQMTCAERNRAAAQPQRSIIGLGLTSTAGPLKLQVSNLHPNITDDMLNDIFEPFGRVVDCQVLRDATGSSKGIANIVFRHTEEGKRALEQLNGFELAGRALRVVAIDQEEENIKSEPPTYTGYGFGSGAKAAQENISDGSKLLLKGSEIPQAEQAPMLLSNPSLALYPQTQEIVKTETGIPDIATQCFMLSNMFDPTQESEPGWDFDVRDDVIDECNNHGGTVHVYVDKMSHNGNVYVKCSNVNVAYKSVQALHGRWFAGKVITANYVPVASYHQLFPESMHAQSTLQTRPR